MSKVYVKKSGVQGKGVFTKKDIKKGEIVFISRGKVIISKNDNQVGHRWLGINKITWLNPFANNPLYYTNHSCNPNTGIKGRVILIALRNIKKDEEITFDYSISEEDKFWQMKCGCGAKNCRKIIRSIQFLPVKTFKKYLPYVPTYFKKVYMKYHKIKNA